MAMACDVETNMEADDRSLLELEQRVEMGQSLHWKRCTLFRTGSKHTPLKALPSD
jgi:hypothetical protein